MIYSYKKQNNKRGFALLYVILFVFLIVITVLVTWATSMAESRMHRRTEGTTQAYQLAKAGLDKGWEDYHALPPLGIGEENPIPEITIPSNACSNSLINRYTIENETLVEAVPFLTEGISFSDSIHGVYDYRVCNITDPIEGDKILIDGIGYYKGTQVTLRGEINHDNDNPIFDFLGIQIGINHSNDTLFIYQVGPLAN